MQKILIVEDEKAIANLIKINLEAEGYRCTCVYDGKSGADCIESELFDLILLDIMLPEIDGYELLEYIKPLGTPVIFLTAKSAVDDRIRGLKLGADDYIVKPFQVGSSSRAWRHCSEDTGRSTKSLSLRTWRSTWLPGLSAGRERRSS